MKELLGVLIGSMPAVTFMAAMIFCLLGFFISKYVGYKRSKNNPKTPEAFSWSFWWRNNADEVFGNLIIMFCLVRFAPEVVTYFFPQAESFFNGADNMLIYLFLGLFFTYIVRRGKDKLLKVKK